jgi:hypothetical protein
MISEGLFDLILTTPEINNLVDGSIHQGSLTKGYTLPAIRFFEVTATPIVSNSGTAGLLYQTWQFDCLDNSYLGCHRLRDVVKSLLQDYAGTLGEGTNIYSSRTKNFGDHSLEEGAGASSGSGYIYGCHMDVEFAYDSSGMDVLITVPAVELDIDDTGQPQFNSDDLADATRKSWERVLGRAKDALGLE